MDRECGSSIAKLVADELLHSNYATMRFKPESEHGANKGLNIAREHMQKIKEEFPWCAVSTSLLGSFS